MSAIFLALLFFSVTISRIASSTVARGEDDLSAPSRGARSIGSARVAGGFRRTTQFFGHSCLSARLRCGHEGTGNGGRRLHRIAPCGCPDRPGGRGSGGGRPLHRKAREPRSGEGAGG